MAVCAQGGEQVLRKTTPLPFISRGAGVQGEDMAVLRHSQEEGCVAGVHFRCWWLRPCERVMIAERPMSAGVAASDAAGMRGRRSEARTRPYYGEHGDMDSDMPMTSD